MLVAIFVLLRISDAFCFQAAYSALHPSPAMRGLTMIAGVWTTIFLVAVWMQKRWARYFLVISLGAVALVGSTIIFAMSFDLREALAWPGLAYVAQGAVYLAAASVLIRSEDIRRLVERSRMPVTGSGLL
jgi:hypothetical protein